MSQTKKLTKTVQGTTQKFELNNPVPMARNSSTLMVGSHYKLGKRFGKGNFGEIRLGKNMLSDEDVAIKTVCHILLFY